MIARHPLDDDARFQALLEAYAPLQSVPLLPELRLHQARVLEDLWERMEAMAGARLEPPYWAFLWPGGLAVARYLLDRPGLIAGRRLLDVATGNGVIALAAALAGAAVTANDVDPLSMRAVRLHAGYHRVTLELAPGDLLGIDPATLPYEVITVGDAFYEGPLAVRLEPWLHAAHRSGRVVLLGDPGRNFLPARGLTPVAEYPVPTLREVEGRPERIARVFRLEDGCSLAIPAPGPIDRVARSGEAIPSETRGAPRRTEGPAVRTPGSSRRSVSAPDRMGGPAVRTPGSSGRSAATPRRGGR